MKITIRPDPDCIELIRSEFKDKVIDFLKSLGISENDAENWEAPHNVEINEHAPPMVDVFDMKCYLPEELFAKTEWVFKFAKDLTSFVISGHSVCYHLISTDGLKHLPKNILNLSCVGYDSETLNQSFEELKNLPSLKSISFKNYTKLKDISLLVNFVNLQMLNLSNCDSLANISGLAGLVNLQSLNLSNCKSLTDISGLTGLVNLQTLDLRDCSSLTDLSSLAGLLDLQSLNLSGCKSLTDISILSGLVNLQSLDLHFCESLTKSNLAGLNKLQTLDLSRCESLTDISSLSGLLNLQSIDFEWCRSLKDISSLSGLVNLRSLRLSAAESLTDISSLSGLVNLQSLDFHNCKSLADINSLSGMLNLQFLNLCDCKLVTDINSLLNLLNLKMLDLSGCELLTDINSLANLLNLQWFNIKGCKRIQKYLFLRNCLALNYFNGSKMHPTELAELLCFLAVQRKDLPFISEKAVSWLQELELGLGQNHPATNDLACSLAQSIILANLDEVGLSFHQNLLNQPRFGLTPWKIWLNENLKTHGWDKIQKLAELNKPSELTFGAIGGISSCLPSLEGDPVQIAWAKKWISEIYSLHNNNPNFLKPAAADWCLALKRLGENELLREWIEKFTDPSDPSALDPINKVFSAYALDLNDSESALEYALKINDPKFRDESILNLAQQFIKEGETTKAGEFLFLLTQVESRTQLAYSLAQDATYLKSDENANRLLAACGDNPQSLASILDKLRLTNPDSKILKIMHEKLSYESKLQIPVATVVKECNSLAEFLIHSKDPSQLVRIQQAIESVLKSS